MSTCKICGADIPYGKSYKGDRFKQEKFCSEACYQVRLSQSQRAPKGQSQPKPKPIKTPSDRRKVTDLIQSIYGEDANWAFLGAQLKNIMHDYELEYKEVYYILKYSIYYEQVVVDKEFGLYQIFPKYIEPTEKFRAKLSEAKERADEIGAILPIKVKKYRPQRKIKDDLTFD